MEENAKALLLLLVVTLPCLIGAYLIGIKKMMFLVAGWDDSRIDDINAFATMFGWSLFILGLNVASAALLNYYRQIGEQGVVLIVLLSAILPVATAIYGQIRFKKPV